MEGGMEALRVPTAPPRAEYPYLPTVAVMDTPMSLDTSLTTLGLSSLDEATPTTLRRAFTAALKEAHPDRGGNDMMFDEILSAYAHVTSVLKRQSGGRDGLAPVLDVEEVQQTREKQFIHELNNSVYDVLDSLSDASTFSREFNEQFEKLHVSESKGYAEWLQEGAPLPTDTPVTPLSYHALAATVLPADDEKMIEGVDSQFHQRFESHAPRVVREQTDLILHPNEMATCSGSLLGMTLMEKDEPYTSSLYERPEYSDVFHAYTSDHLLFDKLPVFSEDRSVEDRMAACVEERERVYEAVEDREKAMIQAYEKKREEEEAEHKRKITAYFQQTASSQWALRGSA